MGKTTTNRAVKRARSGVLLVRLEEEQMGQKRASHPLDGYLFVWLQQSSVLNSTSKKSHILVIVEVDVAAAFAPYAGIEPVKSRLN